MEGFKAAEKLGSEIQDPILYSEEQGYYRASNHLGGLEAWYVKRYANYREWCDEAYSNVV